MSKTQTFTKLAEISEQLIRARQCLKTALGAVFVTKAQEDAVKTALGAIDYASGIVDDARRSILPAPEWLRDRMDAVAKLPPPPLREVEEHFRASAQARDGNAGMTPSDQS